MIHGRYKLELHCDGSNANEGCWLIGHFTGKNGGEARKRAREAGWVVLIYKNKALCKDCRTPTRK